MSAIGKPTDCNDRRAIRTLAAVSIVMVSASEPGFAQLAVRAETLYTMAGPRDGKVEAVGPAAELKVPADVRTLHGTVVTPGLVDAHSVVGLAGILNIALGIGGLGSVVAHDRDQLDRSEPIQPELRAIDAFDIREPLVIG